MTNRRITNYISIKIIPIVYVFFFLLTTSCSKLDEKYACRYIPRQTGEVRVDNQIDQLKSNLVDIEKSGNKQDAGKLALDLMNNLIDVNELTCEQTLLVWAELHNRLCIARALQQRNGNVKILDSKIEESYIKIMDNCLQRHKNIIQPQGKL